MKIIDRAFNALNLSQFSHYNSPDEVGVVDLKCPHEEQYILRMLIKELHGEFRLPSELEWVQPMLNAAINYQDTLGILQPYCYITVRHGLVKSVTDDEWHIDGYTANITHLPEQNYFWNNVYPTEYIEKRINFPSDFDGRKHNIQWFFQDIINENDEVFVMKPASIYCVDPYVIHRRPHNIPPDARRTFVRISFTPTEIIDCYNTQNPLILKILYKRDGVKDFRNTLERYKI